MTERDDRSGFEDGLAEEGDADDRVIGVAFRASLIALLAALTIAAAAWGLRSWLAGGEVEPVVEPEQDLGRLLRTAPVRAAPPAVYRDVAAEAGIDFVHVNGATGDRLLPETMGGGVAVIDFDLDRDPDLLFVNSGPWPGSSAGGRAVDTLRLYRNDGGRFVEVTEETGLAGAHGYGMGAAIGDADGDGRDDIFLTTVGANRLFLNRADGFVNATGSAGVAGSDAAWSTSAGFFDADADGDLDLMVLNYVEWSREIDFEVDYRLTGIGRAYGPPSNFAGSQPYFYRNLGAGRFEEVGLEAGLHVTNPATGEAVGKGLALMPADLDRDGDLDVMVANDTVRNFAYLNKGDGTFEEAGTLLGLGFDRNGLATGAMGIDAEFIDDQALAIGIGNFANEMSSLYVSRDGVSFADEAIGRGIGAPSRAALTFGLFFIDYDLDGRLDFLQVNGHVENEINRVQASQRYAQPAQLFWNCGPDCAPPFVLVPSEATGDLARPVVGRGAIYLDFDGDGQLEVVVTQIAGPPMLLDRGSSERAPDPSKAGARWLRVALDGPPGNPRGIGARIEIEAGGRRQVRAIMPTRSYLSQVEPVATFGLGDIGRVDRVTVTWPDGTTSERTGVPADRELRIAID
ncbi:CRTAC1 family protein [Halomonas denitrificans]|nr:CRTAC1 family protein [Halomonas denitrificans]